MRPVCGAGLNEHKQGKAVPGRKRQESQGWRFIPDLVARRLFVSARQCALTLVPLRKV